MIPNTFRAVFSGIMAASLLLASTSACAAPSQYMGIAFAPGAASPDLQALAQRARAGDKWAQLRCNYGDGVDGALLRV